MTTTAIHVVPQQAQSAHYAASNTHRQTGLLRQDLDCVSNREPAALDHFGMHA
jgi:hypothetical protein